MAFALKLSLLLVVTDHLICQIPLAACRERDSIIFGEVKRVRNPTGSPGNTSLLKPSADLHLEIFEPALITMIGVDPNEFHHLFSYKEIA